MVFNTLLRGSETLWTGLRIYSTAKVHRFCVISDDMLQSMCLKFPPIAPNALIYMLNPVFFI